MVNSEKPTTIKEWYKKINQKLINLRAAASIDNFNGGYESSKFLDLIGPDIYKAEEVHKYAMETIALIILMLEDMKIAKYKGFKNES